MEGDHQCTFPPIFKSSREHQTTTDLTSWLPLVIAAAEDATIDLTTVSVCDKMSAMVTMAGSARSTAYRNPRLKNIIMRTAKHTTNTNQKGTVIVTSDHKLNPEE